MVAVVTVAWEAVIGPSHDCPGLIRSQGQLGLCDVWHQFVFLYQAGIYNANIRPATPFRYEAVCWKDPELVNLFETGPSGTVPASQAWLC